MKIRTGKGYLAGVLAAAMVLWAATLPGAWGADAIQFDQDCSISLELGEIPAGYVDINQDLKTEQLTTTIDVALYRVAEVDAYAKFSGIGPYAAVQSTFFDKITSKTSREEYLNQARLFAVEQKDTYLTADTLVWQDSVTLDPAAPAATTIDTLNQGAYAGKDITPGMYLVVIQPVETDYSRYEFAPYLASLPYNYYQDGGKDEWIYETKIGLKPTISPMYGDLEITKSLKGYNQSLGQVSFVFRITAWDRSDVNKTNPIYSNILSLKFGDFQVKDADGNGKYTSPDKNGGIADNNRVGERSCIVRNFPAGTQVEVEEVYHGAAYEATGSTKANVIIRKRSQDVNTDSYGPWDKDPVQVVFENDYNETPDPSYGVQNHFTDKNGGTGNAKDWALDGKAEGDKVDSGEYNEDSQQKVYIAFPYEAAQSNAQAGDLK